MDGKYWRTHPEWERSRSFVMERDGGLIAHGAIVPLWCDWEGQRLKMIHVIDWVAKRDSTGAGIVLLKRIGQLADGLFVAGGSEMTEKIVPVLGFRDSADATRFALPLRPFARLRSDPARSWKPAARCARDVLRMTRVHLGVTPGWGARRVQPADLATVQFPTPRSMNREALFERAPAGIAYLLGCPAAPAELYLVERDGSPRGYLVLTLAVTQCRIAEAWVEPAEAADWHALYMLAIREAKSHREIAEISTVASTTTELQALQRAGFRPRGQVHLRFWTRSGKAARRRPSVISWPMGMEPTFTTAARSSGDDEARLTNHP